MNLPKRIKWSFKGSLTSKQMSRGKKYFGWENYPVEFVSRNSILQEKCVKLCNDTEDENGRGSPSVGPKSNEYGN